MTTLLTRLMRSVPYQAETKTAEKPSLLRRLICAAPYKGEKTAQDAASRLAAVPTVQAGDTTNPLWGGWSGRDAVSAGLAGTGAWAGHTYAPQAVNQTIGRVPYLTEADRVARRIVAEPSTYAPTYFQGAANDADETLVRLLKNNHIPKNQQIPVVRDALRDSPSVAQSTVFERAIQRQIAADRSQRGAGATTGANTSQSVARPTTGANTASNLNKSVSERHPHLSSPNNPNLARGAVPLASPAGVRNMGLRVVGPLAGAAAGFGLDNALDGAINTGLDAVFGKE